MLHTFSRTLELTINTIATTGGRAAPVRRRLRGHHGLPGQVRVPVRARRVLRDVVQVARQDRDAAEQGSVFGLVNVNFDDFFALSTNTNTSGHKYELFKPRCTASIRQKFFVDRVIYTFISPRR